MSTTKHPGKPWELYFDEGCAQKASITAGIGNVATIHPDFPHWKQNAHLIAAAPELLAALEGMFSAVANAKSEAFERSQGNTWNADSHAMQVEKRLTQASAAIARARGVSA